MRNPNLVRMFRYVGFAEEAGTGIAEIRKAWRDLGYSPPRIDIGTDRYEFSLELRFAHFISDEDRNWLHQFGETFSEPEQLALLHAKHEGFVDNESLRAMTNIHPSDATRCLTRLKDRQYLSQFGARRGTKYQLGSSAPAIPIKNYDTSSEGMTPNSEGIDAILRSIAAPATEKSRLAPNLFDDILVSLCSVQPLSLAQLAGLMDRQENYMRLRLRDLISVGRINYLYPKQRNHPEQKYVAVTIA